MMRRLPDWPRRFVDFVEQRAAAPFTWGWNDCVLFAADEVQAITGADPIASLRGAWASERAALRALRACGGLEAAVRSVLGEPLATPALAQRGDVLLVRAPERDFLAVCDAHRWVAPARRGLASGPIETAALAWGIGHA